MFLSTAHLTLYKSLFGEMSKEYFFLAQRYKAKNPQTGGKTETVFQYRSDAKISKPDHVEQLLFYLYGKQTNPV